MTDLAVIILNYNTKKITLECLGSIMDKQWENKINVVVVDNASSDGSVAAIRKKYPEIKIISSPENIGFSRGNNLGIKNEYKRSRYCLVLNSDTLVQDGALDALVDAAEEGEYDIISCKLLNTDKSFQPNAGNLPTALPLFFWLSNLDGLFNFLPSYQEREKRYYSNNKEVGWVSGSVIMFNSKVFKRLGFFDEKIFMYAEDVDLCWRAKKKGLRVGWTDKAEIVHIGGASLSGEPRYKQWLGEFGGLIYLYKKHYSNLAAGILKLLIYLFTGLRIIAFSMVGNKEYARTYAKIIRNI